MTAPKVIQFEVTDPQYGNGRADRDSEDRPYRYALRRPKDRALVVVNDGKAALLFWIGPNLDEDVQMSGRPDCLIIDQVCWDGETNGLYIWEGFYHSYRCSYEYDEWDTEPVGEYRDLTEEEWNWLVELEFKEPPWDYREWI